jgi:hypothetical protein
MTRPTTVYVIYDERAVLQGTDEACVLESCGSLREVTRSDFDGRAAVDGAVYEYDLRTREGGDPEAVNERFVGMVSAVKRGEATP